MLRTTIAALAAMTISTAALAGNCTTNTPLDLTNVGGLLNPGNSFAGTAVCPDAKDNTGDLLAIGAAMANPVWLEANERFAVSGGLGFSGDGDTAVGATGVMRFDRNVSGYAGAAVGTENTDLWAGKAGVRVGW